MLFQSFASRLLNCRVHSFFIVLALITLVGAALRVYKLGDYPGGFGQDEAVVLYDAWALLTTGAEHHGERWPINAREFGDYPSALPSYFMMPVVALFGPSAEAHRMFGALLNTTAVLVLGLLARLLFRSDAAGLFAAALLAVSPWNIFFSRWTVSGGYCTFFQVLALWALYRLLTREGKPGCSLPRAIGVGLLLYLWTHTYLSQYFFAPLMIGLAFLLWQRGSWPRILVAGGTYSILMLLTIWARLGAPDANGRVECHSILYADNPVSLFWRNYCDYHSLTFLFNAPQMLTLQSLRGVPHINHLLWPLYLLGLVALVAAAVAPALLLKHLGRQRNADDLYQWRRTAIWVLAGTALAPLAGALFLDELYTARVTHHLVQVLLVTAFGCAVVWHLLQRIPIRFAGLVFVVLFAAYLGQQTLKTARGLIRNNVHFSQNLQAGLPEVMRYLARQTGVRSAHFPPLRQGYIYHLCFTPVHPAKLNYSEVSPPDLNPHDRWRYVKVDKVGHYFFNQNLNREELERTATLRHQVRDRTRIWYDLYEKQGDWFILQHE